MRSPPAFYVPGGDGTFESTAATAGPWSADSQHGGPPSALLAREFECTEPDPGQRLARLTVEILRPVPVIPLLVRARVVRPGRRVTLLEGAIEGGGETYLLARGWRIARTEVPVPATGARDSPPTVPDTTWAPEGWAGVHTAGYMAAIEVRLTSGQFAGLGPAAAWTRSRLPLIAGEAPTPFQRLAIVADSGSGLSQGVDFGRWLAINVELTVSAHRDPVGEWIHMDASTVIGPNGTGRTDTVLSDSEGDVGRALQTLFVSPRD